MRILITGHKGQLGGTLMEALQHHDLEGIDLPETDITRLAVVEVIASLRPDLVIHAAAMTDVDGCARDPEAAYLINALGTRNVALGCLKASAEMLYISTNEVFDGERGEAYTEFDATNPINAYGRSKLAGERAVSAMLDRCYIVRTAWLFGAADNNFPTRILRRARETDVLRVVVDEVASPTYAPDLAAAIVRLIATEAYGVYHLTNAGSCSRFDFAAAVLDVMGVSDVRLAPIALAEYPRPSRPPRYSVLRNLCAAQLGIELRPWQQALAEWAEGKR